MKFLKLILCLLFFKTQAQEALIVYPTYNSFINKQGIIYSGNYIKTPAFSLLNTTLKFKNVDPSVSKEKQIIKLKKKDIWGFSSNGKLYVSFKNNSMGFVAHYNEDFVLFIVPHDFELPYIQRKKSLETYYIPYDVYLSKNLNSELIYVRGAKANDEFINKLKLNFTDKDLYHQLLHCFGNNLNYKKQLECMGYPFNLKN